MDTMELGAIGELVGGIERKQHRRSERRVASGFVRGTRSFKICTTRWITTRMLKTPRIGA